MKLPVILVVLLLGTQRPGLGQSVDGDDANGDHQESSVHIQIDAAKTVGKLRPVWRYFGADEPNYAYMPDGAKLLGELGQLSPTQIAFRTHHLLTSGTGEAMLKWGSTNVYAEDAQGNAVYDWTILDRIFDMYKAKGIRPYVQIGFMPKALSSKPDPYENHWGRGEVQGKDWLAGWSCPPKDNTKWGELVYQWARHCGERYGWDEAASWHWEVWNEPNLYWSGTQGQFFDLYDYAVDGVRRALPTAKVGGIETAGGPGGTWLKNFLEHCRSGTNKATGKIGAPLDFISFHAKGSPKFIDGHVEMGISAELKNMNDAFNVVAGFPEFRHLPIVVGEADPEGLAAGLGPQLAYRTGALYAAYTACCFARALELADQHDVNLEGLLTWAFEFENKPYFAGYRVLATRGIDLPILNLFRMYSRLGGQRVTVASSGAVPLDTVLKTGVRGVADVDAVASLEGKKLSVIVWNYHDDDVPAASTEVELTLGHLPFQGTGKVSHYRIDGEHSNAHNVWKNLGSPQSPAPGEYAQMVQAGQLEAFEPPQEIKSVGGTVMLRDKLPREGVSLFIIEWE